MRKFFFGLLLSLCVVFAVGCDVSGMSTLPELSKPYAAVYRCIVCKLGEKDLLENFERLSIDLQPDDTFELSYRTVKGEEGTRTGTYVMDVEREEISFTVKSGKRERTRTFPVKKGTIFVDANIMGKLFHAEFSLS